MKYCYDINVYHFLFRYILNVFYMLYNVMCIHSIVVQCSGCLVESCCTCTHITNYLYICKFFIYVHLYNCSTWIYIYTFSRLIYFIIFVHKQYFCLWQMKLWNNWCSILLHFMKHDLYVIHIWFGKVQRGMSNTSIYAMHAILYFQNIHHII